MASMAPQNSRLRLACDNCAAAKIKCDKKQPACGRCTRNGLSQCTYSMSRRYGKQSLAKRGACECAKAAAAGIQPKPTTSLSQGIDTSMGTSTLMMDGQSWDPDNVSFNAMLDGTHALTPTLTQCWTNFDSMDLGDVSSTPLVSSTNLQYSTFGPTNETGVQTFVEHDCEARAIAVLRSLQHYSTSPTAHPPGSSAAAILSEREPVVNLDLYPSFDKVLVTNKVALSGWSELMRCPCAQCPHLTFLYVSILWKVLFWYRVAATGNGAPEDNSTSRLAPSPQIAQFNVRPTSVQVGVLDLDPESQEDVRRVVLRGELRKVEKAIDEMVSVDDDPESDAHQPAKWCGLGIPAIQAELQDIIQKV
ncbi:hypothetical protein K505DRAFT_326896, partial [Melanomma pulvis-pyrius CBS 109.77]